MINLNLGINKIKARVVTATSASKINLQQPNRANSNVFSSKKPWQSHFNRDLLPDPTSYYRSQGLRFYGGLEWKSAICPFHQDTQPSLRVRIDNGAFKCMACGAHGGDVLAFHRQRYKLSFKDAARDLGAWRVL